MRGPWAKEPISTGGPLGRGPRKRTSHSGVLYHSPTKSTAPCRNSPVIVREMKTVLYRYWAPHVLAADEQSP
jgi:hypothetical protein